MAVSKNLTIMLNNVDAAKVFTTFTPSASQEALDSTTLSDNNKRYVAGFKDATASASGVWDADEVDGVYEVGSVDLFTTYDVLTNVFTFGTVCALSVAFNQIAIGDPALMFSANVTALNQEVPLAQLVMTSAEFQTTNGVRTGVWLASESVIDGAFSTASFDGTASSSNGGLLHVHVEREPQNVSGIKLQHSTNNSTWADLVDVSAATPILASADSAWAITIPVGTTINRYLRMQWTSSGAPLQQQFIRAAFARF